MTNGVADPVEVDGIDLQRDQDTPVLRFDATGKCKFIVKSVDCGV